MNNPFDFENPPSDKLILNNEKRSITYWLIDKVSSKIAHNLLTNKTTQLCFTIACASSIILILGIAIPIAHCWNN